MKKQYRYIHFVEQDSMWESVLWHCYNSRTRDLLGIVCIGAWGKLMFQPKPNTEYSIDCLRDIADFIDQLRKESP